MDYGTPQFYRLGAAAAAADRDVIDMVSGDPDWRAPEALHAGLEAYADRGRDDPPAYQYPPPAGIDELREAIAKRRNVPREAVLVTHGATQGSALAIAAALARGAGQEVILADPTYPYYPGIVDLFDGTTTAVQVGPSGALSAADVRAVAGPETAAILVNTPNNPTGAVYDERLLTDLEEIATSVDALLVSDETYDHFVLEGAFASTLGIDSDRCVTVGSFSKTLAITGFRVGYTVVPAAVRDAIHRRHMLTAVTASRPAQTAVAAALERTSPPYYRKARERLRERRGRFGTILEAAGAEVQDPSGGFYVLVRLPGWPGTMGTAERLIDEVGVAAMPGETFGSIDEWFRFALVTPRTETAAQRIAEAI